MVRVLSPHELPVNLESGKKRKKKGNSDRRNGGGLLNYCGIGVAPPEKKHEELIIHFHGGGFVSMGSGSHQTYTRVWANETGFPIFSVDYRLAPDHPFPAALNDCWQVYYWLVMNSEKELGIKPRRIVLVGDSAGGNLVAAVTVMAIERQFRVPDGIVLCYPGNFFMFLILSALSVSMNRFTPSYLLGIDDPLLNYPFLKMCTTCYTGNQSQCSPDTCMFLSPSVAPDRILKHFPKTRIMVAGNDPLRDESFIFA